MNILVKLFSDTAGKNRWVLTTGGDLITGTTIFLNSKGVATPTATFGCFTRAEAIRHAKRIAGEKDVRSIKYEYGQKVFDIYYKNSKN